jgi:hypothetical protein
MKKSTTLLFLILFAGISISQNLRKNIAIEQGKPFKMNKGNIHYVLVEGKNQHFYVVEGSPKRTKKEFYILEYNQNMEEINRMKIDLVVGKERHAFEKLIFINDKLYLFTNYSNSKSKLDKLYIQTLDLKTLQPKSKPREISRMEAKRSTFFNGNQFRIKFSPDSSKLLIFNDILSSKKEKLKYGLSVLDVNNNFEELWEQQFVSDKLENLKDIKKYVVSNEGIAYLLFKEFKTKRKEKISGEPNYNYQLKEFYDNGEKSHTTPINLKGHFITDMSLGINQNSDLVCTGFYSSVGSSGIKGCYYMLIDNETKEVRKESKKEFGIDFITSNMSDKRTKRIKKKKEKGKEFELYNYDLDDIILRNDGGVIQVAEQYYVTQHTYTDSNGNSRTTYTYHYNNIIVISISPEGEIEWARKIRKRQSTSGSTLFISYHLSIINNKLFFFYNGNAENLLGSEKGDIKSWSRGKKTTGIVTELNKEGYIRKDVFYDYISQDAIIMTGLTTSLNNEEVLFLSKKKKKAKYLKLKIKE